MNVSQNTRRMSQRNKDGKGDDLKNMLISFRISELQTLLASCGRSRSGRKHELLGRAVSLLKSSEGSAMRERVRTRILELYNQRMPTNGGSPGSSENGDSIVPPANTYSQPYLGGYDKDTAASSYINRANYQNQSTQKEYPQQPNRTNNFSAAMPPLYVNNPRNIQLRPVHPASSMPIHPDVRFISLPFYDIVDVLIKPTSLVQKTMSGYQDTNLVYHLTPYQTQLITNSRSYHIKSMMEYAVQVQLRFCLAESSCVQEDLYPSRVKIIVNSKSCPIPGQPPPNAQNQEPRKPHRPVNITTFCSLSLQPQSNQIQVQWLPSDLGKRYVATVHLVKTVRPETLIQQLSSKPMRSKAHSIAFIKEILCSDPDSEIAMTSLKVSLHCPIDRTRMKYPCRANNCKHLQCFDGSTYIQMNERKPSWVCPVCDQKAHYEDLFKDGLFISIIAEATDCEDIVFFEDASWRPLADIAQGPDPSKSLAEEIVNTPIKPSPPSRAPNVDCSTPPVLSINTPDTTPIADPEVLSNRPMPILEPITTPPIIEQPTRIEDDSNSSAPAMEKEKDPEEPSEEVEVICIADSDSEDELPLAAHSASHSRPDVRPSTPTIKESNTSTRYDLSEGNDDSRLSASPVPFSNPELQGLELYNLLPHEDRIAAAMFLDQNGILGQLAQGNNSNSRSSPSSIISISDE